MTFVDRVVDIGEVKEELFTIFKSIIGLLAVQNLTMYLFLRDNYTNYWLDILLYAILAFILLIFFFQTKKYEFFVSFICFFCWVLITLYWRSLILSKFIQIPRDITDNNTDWASLGSFYPLTFLIFLGAIFLLIGLVFIEKGIYQDHKYLNWTFIYGLFNSLSVFGTVIFFLFLASGFEILSDFGNVLALVAGVCLLAKYYLIPAMGIISYSILFYSLNKVSYKYIKSAHDTISF
jgi:hypothetical protein